MEKGKKSEATRESSELNAKISSLARKVTYTARSYIVSSAIAYEWHKEDWAIIIIIFVMLVYSIVEHSIISALLFGMSAPLLWMTNAWLRSKAGGILFKKWRELENDIKEWRYDWNERKMTTGEALIKFTEYVKKMEVLKRNSVSVNPKSKAIAKAKLSNEFPEHEVSICKSYGYDESLLDPEILEEAKAQKK